MAEPLPACRPPTHTARRKDTVPRLGSPPGPSGRMSGPLGRGAGQWGWVSLACSGCMCLASLSLRLRCGVSCIVRSLLGGGRVSGALLLWGAVLAPGRTFPAVTPGSSCLKAKPARTTPPTRSRGQVLNDLLIFLLNSGFSLTSEVWLAVWKPPASLSPSGCSRPGMEAYAYNPSHVGRRLWVQTTDLRKHGGPAWKISKPQKAGAWLSGQSDCLTSDPGACKNQTRARPKLEGAFHKGHGWCGGMRTLPAKPAPSQAGSYAAG